jgi:hypothetical protein
MLGFLRENAGRPKFAFLCRRAPQLRGGRVSSGADRQRHGPARQDGVPICPPRGRERAKARGVKLGRKPKLTDHQKREAIHRRDHDGEPVREIARSYNVSHSTISRL